MKEQINKRSYFTSKKLVFHPFEKPSQAWQDKALEHLSKWKQNMKGSRHAQNLLKKRGITVETAELFGIGYNDRNIWETRESWGLNKEKKQDGKESKIWLPRGLVIPRFEKGLDSVIGLKIRRDEWTESDKLKKYAEVSGSANCMGIYGNSLLEVVVVVESEFDAILINQEAGDLCFAVSLGGAGGKRLDQFTYLLLCQCSLILLSFDCDRAGDAELVWWQRIFPDAKHWPASIGKSPGDAFVAGEDLRKWVEIALLEYGKLKNEY